MTKNERESDPRARSSVVACRVSARTKQWLERRAQAATVTLSTALAAIVEKARHREEDTAAPPT